MKKFYILIGSSLFMASLIGCSNTLNAVGVIPPMYQSVDHIGKGVKADLTDDDKDASKEN